MEEVVRLTGADYEQAIDSLDLVFSQRDRPHRFETALPRMCVPDDEHMGRHFAVKVDGRIVSMLGVYPLPVVIAGERFLFSTTGNVATKYRYEGRGYAHRLLNRAMEELGRIGADASRLGGFRQRYNRFGFEIAGSVYRMNVGKANIKQIETDPLRFVPIEKEDKETLAAAQRIQTRAPFYCDRGDADGFYRTLIAWQARPFAVYDADTLVGCLCASADGCRAEEIIARDAEIMERTVICWIRQMGVPSLTFSLPPWNLEAVRRLSRICQSLSIDSPSQFKIINWAGIANALCRVQNERKEVPDGEFVLGIQNGPTLRFLAEGGKARCEETGAKSDLTLNALEATRFVFGPQAPCTVAPVSSALVSALLPLPLTWCGQDRV